MFVFLFIGVVLLCTSVWMVYFFSFSPSGVDASQLEKVRELWDALDTNKKGVISREDLAEVLYASNVDAAEEEMEELMNELDKDGDGFIRYDQAHVVAINLNRESATVAYSFPTASRSLHRVLSKSKLLKVWLLQVRSAL